ncbi:hypothetical protein A5697_09480 [Mycobacterium sp. E3251]|uniref:hypothetical protein n=1 Tax=unclassified Mycobacterium TaxID=2642494 RepID=UPI0008015048|nr:MULTISPECIES: hypothetical protein [unclassified Mycobacterium]OBG91631.1 hypothetical protein A5697_09480 [Mycobacterium sp. E3251]OBI25124.1 hypothetical protein A5709_09305 [Mycobacterium sp. E1386]OBI36597.1 hypothetical protein A5711_14485 [Mycobacterium sp. E2238]
MRSVRTLTTATLVAATVFGGVGTASIARATTKEEVAVNGTFRVTSIGDYAQRNDQYFGEPTVVQTWTISSTCETFQECHGTLSSDQGWTAPLYMNDGEMWKAKREVPNWERCEDGTAFNGQQTFFFYPVNQYGGYQLGSSTYAGKDKTVGPSGACGQNQWLDITMPLRLDKLS